MNSKHIYTHTLRSEVGHETVPKVRRPLATAMLDTLAFTYSFDLPQGRHHSPPQQTAQSGSHDGKLTKELHTDVP